MIIFPKVGEIKTPSNKEFSLKGFGDIQKSKKIQF
jgi:hypothetical protein